MDKAQVTETLTQSVAKITEQLGTFDRDTLIEMQAQETAANQPRATLLSAIEARLVALDAEEEQNKPPESDADRSARNNLSSDKTPPAVDGKGTAADKPAAKLTPADWQHPDYTGPLHGEQAAWRTANLKPVRGVRTK